jgi:hypothetical protein
MRLLLQLVCIPYLLPLHLRDAWRRRAFTKRHRR